MYGSPGVYPGATFAPASTSITPAPITSVTPGQSLNRVWIVTVCPTRSLPTRLMTPLVVRDASTTSPLVDPTGSLVCAHGSGCAVTVYWRTIAVLPVFHRGAREGSSCASQ